MGLQKEKTQLVAKGFQQDPRVNLCETFSPIAKMTTITIILAIAVSLNWKIHEVDVNNTFLNGDLKEEIFMVQPEGFVDKSYPNHVCKLNKAIYGLKHDSRAWYDRLRNTLMSWGFVHKK